jgi:YfiH family protein
MSPTPEVMVPSWPAPPGVRAFFTTRRGGVSAAPFAQLNLGTHVGDAASAVRENRLRLRQALGLPQEPRLLRQVHGGGVLDAGDRSASLQCDASVAAATGVVCVVLVADCLPVLLCSRDGANIAAVHAGWRGLLAGILQATVRRLAAPSSEVLAWLGPAIGADAFEVGPEVRRSFVARHPKYASAFRPAPKGDRWLADICAIARLALGEVGVTQCFGGEWCTYGEPERFFSYRRDRGVTGRMAALIWREPQAAVEPNAEQHPKEAP